MSQWPEGWRRGDDRDGPDDASSYSRAEQDAHATAVLPQTTTVYDRSRPRQPAPGSARPAPPGKRDIWKIVRWALLALLVVVVAWYLILGGYVMTHLKRTDAITDYDGRPGDTAGSNWLVVGSDSRDGLTVEQQRRLKTGDTAGQRTDTIILLHIPDGGAPTLVSLPRDSWVPIPGRGRNKLNAAYAFGGAPLLVRTVEQVTGLHIDHYAEVGFAGVVGMTDAVDGVRLCPDRAIKDAKSGLNVAAGCQTMDGPTALGYVRARYFDPKGDLGRIERQQAYVGALLGEVIGPRTFIDPVRQWQLAKAGTAALTVDRDTGLLDLASLGWHVRELAHGKGTETTVPVANPAYRTPAGVAVLWDREEALELFASLK